MKKTAILFPGQGSQSIGMGLDLYQEYNYVKDLFNLSENITNLNISELCFKGPINKLTSTVNLQPILTTVNIACLEILKKNGIKADYAAGHSLGEYCALNAANIISIEDTLKLVFNRGKLMERDSKMNKGIMHAIIGLPIDIVNNLVKEVDPENQSVSVANHNTETQIVITGKPDEVKQVSKLAKKNGARTIPLKVSGAWHSYLMKNAAADFAKDLDSVEFNKPDKNIVFNVSGDIENDPDKIKQLIKKQLISPVKWHDSILKLIEKKVEVFIEIGPGKVLAGLIKKIIPKSYPYKIINLNTLQSFKNFQLP